MEYNQEQMRALPREIITTAAIALVTFFLLHGAIQTCVVIGSSMEPTVFPQERLIVNKVAYKFALPSRGDIIVFHPPSAMQLDYIKRVIALPGDIVEIKEGAVYVDGERLYEPYVRNIPNYTLPAREIPKNNYFVLGDNRNNSNDSHNGWTIPRQSIIGKVWLCIWPAGSWGVVSNLPLLRQLATLLIEP